MFVTRNCNRFSPCGIAQYVGDKVPQFIQPPRNFDEEIDFQTLHPGSWRSDASSSVFMSLQSGIQNNCYSKNAEDIQDGLPEYFYGQRAVPWQWGLLT